MSSTHIRIEGAREHNLKNVSVSLPRDRLTVVTGLSGSGKSSLAFDTLYAEGQRRYVESLSAYARQFLDQLQKPDVDRVEGLSPAIAIEQRTAGSNPRSIVATTTEIHDYLRVLFAGIGEPHCPGCGRAVRAMSAETIVERLAALPARTRLTVMAPLARRHAGDLGPVVESVRKKGFVRLRLNGKILDVEDVPAEAGPGPHAIDAVVDRLLVTNLIRSRLTDSVETALKHGNGVLTALWLSEGAPGWAEESFSERNACLDCGLAFDRLSARHFSFNSHHGACARCSGLGSMLVFDEGLVIPDRDLSLEDGAIQPWRKGGRRLILYYRQQIRAVAKHLAVDVNAPFASLPEPAKRTILHGTGKEPIDCGAWRGGVFKRSRKPYEGVIPNLVRRYAETDSESVRQTLRRYMSREVCLDCGGARLKKEVLACTVGGLSIADVTRLSVADAVRFCGGLALDGQRARIGGDVLAEVGRRLRFLDDVGLGYLTLDRESGTLSGGEAQRIRLATQIGSGLEGVLYVLDEPSIGLHQRDNERLIRMLKSLRDRGNTVVVVEHDEQIIRAADYVVDLGPGAGRWGGEVVFAGTVPELLKSGTSLTARYLTKHHRIRMPSGRRAAGEDALRIVGARENNLKGIDVTIPLGLFVCVTGVSGSGKSTLVSDILRRVLVRRLYGGRERPGAHERIEGAEKIDKVVVIDQSPIGRTPRSNPATYTGAFTHIRNLFAATAASKVRGYGAGRYSFNVKGGRCEACKGDGVLRLEMHFLPDVYVTCERCGGLRYNAETLEVRYAGRHIADVLAMTVDEALEAFADVGPIADRLRTLSEVGLGYLQLGQSATTLSGGEAQRVKLSAELSRRATGRTLYLLDEPTTGLHFADIQKLLDVLHRLRDAGNTVVVIEHQLDVVMCSDHIIDLGPEGGDGGGRVVVAGPPEVVAACRGSHTGRYLREAMS
jgi:excinuclease ABC subunit A